jgi:hypothetical protein
MMAGEPRENVAAVEDPLYTPPCRTLMKRFPSVSDPLPAGADWESSHHISQVRFKTGRNAHPGGLAPKEVTP